MIETLLILILILVYYNSKLWQRGEWKVNKTKFNIWFKNRRKNNG